MAEQNDGPPLESSVEAETVVETTPAVIVGPSCKVWWRSRTIWLGVATVVIAAVGAAGTIPELAQYHPHILAVVGVLTVALRTVTTEAVGR